MNEQDGNRPDGESVPISAGQALTPADVARALGADPDDAGKVGA